MKRLLHTMVVAAGLTIVPALTQAQVGGNLALFPAIDLFLEITTGPDGEPALSADEFQLITGDYYRLNINCPDVIDDWTGWRVEVSDLLQNSHLRIVSVGDMEIHLQGYCSGPSSAMKLDRLGSVSSRSAPAPMISMSEAFRPPSGARLAKRVCRPRANMSWGDLSSSRLENAPPRGRSSVRGSLAQPFIHSPVG